MKINIISPSGKKVYEDVSSFSVMTEAGQLVILPGHADLLSALEISELVINSGEFSKPQVFAVNGGVLKFADNEAFILTDEMALAQDIIEAEIRQAKEKGKEKQAAEPINTDLIQIEKEIKYEKLKHKIRDNYGE